MGIGAHDLCRIDCSSRLCCSLSDLFGQIARCPLGATLEKTRPWCYYRPHVRMCVLFSKLLLDDNCSGNHRSRKGYKQQQQRRFALAKAKQKGCRSKIVMEKKMHFGRRMMICERRSKTRFTRNSCGFLSRLRCSFGTITKKTEGFKCVLPC